MSEDILIVKCELSLPGCQIMQLYEHLLKQKENGLIILPSYCDVVIAPKDIEIQIEQEGENHGEKT